MGGSWFADDSGEFHMAVVDGHGEVMDEVHLTGLEPGQELYRDLHAGRDR